MVPSGSFEFQLQSSGGGAGLGFPPKFSFSDLILPGCDHGAFRQTAGAELALLARGSHSNNKAATAASIAFYCPLYCALCQLRFYCQEYCLSQPLPVLRWRETVCEVFTCCSII